MHYNNKEPIYLQIVNHIKYTLVLGTLEGGAQLLSIRDQAGKMQVNPNTIARAYQELERQRITFTKKGLGTYITENKNTINQLKKELAQTAMNTFIENMHKIGFNNQELITALNNHLNKEGS